MGMPKTIQDICEDRYPDPEVRAAVIADVEKHKTGEHILSGEMTLPTAKDAKHWHERVTGKLLMTPTERSQGETIKAMQERLLVLESGGKATV